MWTIKFCFVQWIANVNSALCALLAYWMCDHLGKGPHSQNCYIKNHPRDILHDENHLYGIVLVHLTWNTVLKIRKHTFGQLDIDFKNLVKFCLSHCLTDHSHKARDQTKQCMYIILWHKNTVTSGMCLLGFWQVYFIFPFIFH